MGTGRGAGRGVVMVDVARTVGVSQKTVSRVINGAPHVRPEIRARVLAAIEELGYRPNVAARALVMQRTHVIGVLAVATSLFGPASRVFSLEHAARQRGYELALASLPEVSPDELRRAIHGLLARGVEGIVFEVPNHLIEVDDALLGGVPVATSVGQIPHVARQAVIDSSQAEGGRLATQHLLDLGHQTVWHLAGPPEWDAARERCEGWASTLAKAGRQRPPVLYGDWSARSGYQLGRQLAERDDATAVFAANDHQAMGLMCALAEAGRSIPGDVSVVGFDDVPEAEFQMVPLTTIRTDEAIISHAVLSTLVALIEGREPALEQVEVHRELVVRRSSGPPRPTPSGPP
ncbi:LacI family DNA-binding transcriptional regulator [Microlunatus panaciterrae]|uniref:LacI family transcriptional regulator n=1 Tax=Microlunatus panaciterrae TaxID=400768 RepID=A0ABS2RI90_9ACTN|nr:LacI family DNA-binding transcriptional regulator [Microlunatus panaciterrae]MBM7798711.1 LacI family transcriptional regulator [Microlunatus panaciterrae]